MPLVIRKRLIQRVQAEATGTVEDMTREIQGNIGNIIDLKDMAVVYLSRDKELINRKFQKAGRGQFQLIR